ncbi:MAG: hypothetical protein AAF281_12405 [Pseudomonadota bacterium]
MADDRSPAPAPVKTPKPEVSERRAAGAETPPPRDVSTGALEQNGLLF